MNTYPITLEDDYVALIPLNISHTEGLFNAGQHETIWRWTTSSYCGTLKATKSWVNTCIERAKREEQLPFVISEVKYYFAQMRVPIPFPFLNHFKWIVFHLRFIACQYQFAVSVSHS